MDRKLRDYFDAGMRLVWYVYPRDCEVHIYTSLNGCRVLSMNDVLDGGDVLPGFQLPLKQLFEETNQQPRDGN
jgi:Uma2 family endonuclease